MEVERGRDGENKNQGVMAESRRKTTPVNGERRWADKINTTSNPLHSTNFLPASLLPI